MNFLLEEIDNVKILRLREERLDSNIAPDLKTQLLVLLNSESSKVLLDLSSTTYADSSGLGAILLGLRHSRDIGAKFALFGAQKRVKSLLQIAHLEDVMMNYNDEYEALEKLKD